jgi:hypothetical protein
MAGVVILPSLAEHPEPMQPSGARLGFFAQSFQFQ